MDLDRDHLLRFFAAKNHHNLVLCVEDVRRVADGTPERAVLDRLAEVRPDKRLQIVPFGSLVVIPWTQALPREQAELITLQEALEAYRLARQAAGRPSRQDPCPLRTGGGFCLKGCKGCGGAGVVNVLLELDPSEADLAMEE